MALIEFVKLLLISEQRLKTLDFLHFGSHKILQIVSEFCNRRKRRCIFPCHAMNLALGGISRTRSHKKLTVFRHNRFFFSQFQCDHKTVAKLVQKVKRSSKKSHVSTDRLTARKTGNCLRNNGLKNRSRNILPSGSLVNQRLHIGLRKDTAPGRNRVNGGGTLCKLIQPGSIGLKQSSHLINEGTRTTCTGTIHPLLHTAAEIRNLRILAAKLNHHIGLGNQLANRRSGRHNLLNKRNIQPLRNGKTS